MLTQLSIVWLLFLRLTGAVMTTSLVVTTDANGLPVTQTSIFDPATLVNAAAAATPITTVITTTNIAGVLVTLTQTTTPTGTTTGTTQTTPTTTAATTGTGLVTSVITTTNLAGATITSTTVLTPTATTGATGLVTSVFTTTNAAGATVTSTSVVNPTSVTAATTAATGLTTSVYTTTNEAGATLTETSVFSAGASSASSASSETSGSATTTAAVEAGDRPDPSTALTPLPLSPVTTLAIDSYRTVTEGTTKTYTTTRARTSNLWVTIVTGGHTVVVQTTFAQRFTSQYTAVASPSSGSVGLGSLTGEVGRVRSDMESTIKNDAVAYRSSSFISFLAFVMWFL